MSSQKTVTVSPRARSPQSGELWGRDVGLSTSEKSVMPAGSDFLGLEKEYLQKRNHPKTTSEIRCQENHDNARNGKSITQLAT